MNTNTQNNSTSEIINAKTSESKAVLAYKAAADKLRKAAAKLSADEKKTAKKTVTTGKTESRITAAVKAIRTIDGKPVAVKDLVKKADTLYVQGGGPSNVKEALWSMRTVLATEVALDLIVVEDGNVRKAVTTVVTKTV